MNSAEQLRAESHVQRLRHNARKLQASISLNYSPEQLWPYLSNTDQINALAGLNPIQIQTRPQSGGGSEVSVSTRELGLSLRYEEFPYEWTAPHFLQVERIYSQGPLAYLRFEVQLQRQAEAKTTVKVQMSFVPKLPSFLLKPKINAVLQHILKVYQNLEKRLQSQVKLSESNLLAFLEAREKYQAKIDTLTQSWQELSRDTALPRRLAEFIYTAPPQFVYKMRPFELAQLYALDPLESLRFCLKATRAGWLNMSWDLLCPSCRGTKARQAHLSEVNPDLHCESCGIDFSIRFDDNFELTFYPVSHVREVQVFDFCAGSPANTAHIVQQHNFWPGQERQWHLDLPPGQYRLRSLNMKGYQDFEITPEGQNECTLSLGKAFAQKSPWQLAPHCHLKCKNQQSGFQSLKIENQAWRQRRVSAAYVSTLQEFRDLFSSEVLRPGVKLEVANLSIMFTDLKDSTAMYEAQGDASAFNLVQEHFEIMEKVIATHEGGIVKTIGDAIMAVFQNPAQAMACAIAIQETFQDWNRQWQSEQANKAVILKMGLHQGPCIALNLNETLDYFGTTINKAARVQGESVGEDIVISEDFRQAPGVEPLLQSHSFQISPFEKTLKGLQNKALLYRIQWTPSKTPL